MAESGAVGIILAMTAFYFVVRHMDAAPAASGGFQRGSSFGGATLGFC